MDPLYRSRMPVARHVVILLAFCLLDGEAALGSVEGWRVEQQALLFRGGVRRRRRVCIQGRRSLGRVPGRWYFSACFILCSGTSVYCGSFKCLVAIGLRLTYGSWWHLPSDDGRRRRKPKESTCTGNKDFVVISLFSRVFVLLGRISCPLYPSGSICMRMSLCTVSLTFNTDIS
jgi:hypothetical protein